MNQVSPSELNNWISNNEPIQLIDIREPYEFEFSHIETAISIPMAEIRDRLNEIETSKKVILHCRTGKRAEAMIDFLQIHHNRTNLHNLTGGILAWSEEIDASKAPC